MRRVLAITSFAVSAVAARAQTARPVPVRDLGPIISVTSEPVRLFMGLMHFSDGRVLVSDGFSRRLLLFDSTLTHFTVAGDTTGAASIAYGRIPNYLIPFSRDTALFADFTSQTFVVIGPGAKIARVTVPPKLGDIPAMRASSRGADPRGRMVYRGTPRSPPRRPGAPPPAPPDSAPIVRADFDSRTVDTIARVKEAGGLGYTKLRAADGKYIAQEIVSPVTWIDDWTLHADGSIAILRGHDYHIDWISPDGVKTSTPSMPYDWRRLTDEDKQRKIDSMRARFDSLPQEARALTMGESAMLNVASESLSVLTLPNGTKVVPLVQTFVPLSEIPDYVPPIRSGAMKADLDGNLWILPTTSAQSRHGGLVYDVVNRKGELYERVELPAGRSIAGFGPGVVYLMNGDRTKGFIIERARVR